MTTETTATGSEGRLRNPAEDIFAEEIAALVREDERGPASRSRRNISAIGASSKPPSLPSQPIAPVKRVGEIGGGLELPKIAPAENEIARSAPPATRERW